MLFRSAKTPSGAADPARDLMKFSIPIGPRTGELGCVPTREPGAVRPPVRLFSMRARRKEASGGRTLESDAGEATLWDILNAQRAGVCVSSTAHRWSVSAASRTRASATDASMRLVKVGLMSYGSERI